MNAAPLRMLTVREASKQLGVSDDKLREFIVAGEIAASDLRRPLAKLPAYRISQDAVSDFLDRRAVVARSRKLVRHKAFRLGGLTPEA